MRDIVSPDAPSGAWTWIKDWLRPGRTLLVLIPLHLTAFALLYFGLLALVRNEIRHTHSADARILLDQAMRDLHPAMVSRNPGEVRQRLAEFVRVHDLLDLGLYEVEGAPLEGVGPADPEVQRFIGEPSANRFWFSSEDGAVSLKGMLRIPNDPPCLECHGDGESLGVVTMSLDLTSQLGAARTRVQRNLALVIGGWAVLVVLLNLGMRRAARASRVALQSRIGSSGDGRSNGLSSVPAVMLDPMSAELCDLLREVLQRQREREQSVASRLHHTERLASLGRLAAGLAHEIKNPLAGVYGGLELLRDDTGDAEQRRLFEQMLAELERVNGTLHSLLHYARPAPARRAFTDVAELLDETVLLLRPSFLRRGIEVEVVVAPNVTSFSLDRTQMRQVLLNLVNNAADAIEHDGRIRLRASLVEEPRALLVAVEDDGPGITAPELARVFEPFYTTKFQGTGLGLAVARSLVEQHGGRLEAQSQPGQGTTFLVILPEDVPAAADPSGGGGGKWH